MTLDSQLTHHASHSRICTKPAMFDDSLALCSCFLSLALSLVFFVPVQSLYLGYYSIFF